jgi:hypothetical protein
MILPAAGHVSDTRSAGKRNRRFEVRSWLLVATLLLVSMAVLAPECDPYAAVTKVTVTNECQYPFHPNGGSRLNVGDSREMLQIQHGRYGSVSIVRDGKTLATMEVTSLIKDDDPEDYSVTIFVKEPTLEHFDAELSKQNIVSVTVTP